MTRPFHFQQFSVRQERSGMKVGFDAVLLGAWTPAAGARRILDIGTGCGVIALMLAQRQPGAFIDGVEIDAGAAAEAVENVQASPWSRRVAIHHSPIQAYKAAPYDLIVSNPPFFPAPWTPAPASTRRQARQQHALPPGQLLDAADRLLTEDGRLALIWPAAAGSRLLALAATAGLYPLQQVVVYPQPHKPAHRWLLLLGRQRVACVVSRLALETAQHHVYSEEFAALTAEFYLPAEGGRRRRSA